MKKLQIPLIVLLLGVGVFAAWRILQSEPHAADAHAHEHGHGHDDHAEDPQAADAQGPNGGRLLRHDDLTIELALRDDPGGAHFRAFPSRDGKPLAPGDVQLAVELHRLGGRVDRIAFKPDAGFLRSDASVAEPHSFDVVVRAQHGGASAEWTYASYEGRTTLAPEQARAAGIEIAVAGAATIHETLTLHGSIMADPGRVARIAARFPGLIREIRTSPGAHVAAGAVLAVVESNESLQTYEVRSPRAGIISEMTASVGGVAGEAPLFVVSDYSGVWAEVHGFSSNLAKLAAGLPVTIRTIDGALAAEATLPPPLPVAAAESQTRAFRFALPNPEGRWAPGLRVTATVQRPSHQAKLAVRRTALQTFRDFTVVFAQVGDTYEVRMLELGRGDDTHVEVLGGLEPGERYVVANSFLLKADVLKSGASHDH